MILVKIQVMMLVNGDDTGDDTNDTTGDDTGEECY